MSAKRIESVYVRLTKEEKRSLEKLAAREERTISDMLRVLARRAVQAMAEVSAAGRAL